MKKILSTLLLASVALFFSACGASQTDTVSAKASTQQEKPDSELKETYWQLSSFGVSNVAVSGKSHIILKNDGRVTGSGSCNRLMSSYKVEGETIHFTTVASTMMACPNMKEEGMFLRLLSEVTAYKIEGERLDMFKEGKRVLSFKVVYLQ